MRSFALWGGRRGDVQIGSAEDQILCARLNRQAAARVALARFTAAMRPAVDAFAAFADAFRVIAEAVDRTKANAR